MAYNVFDKKLSGGGIKNEDISIKELAEELLKTVIRKFKKRKVQLSFLDNIWGTDPADIQLTSKFNNGCRFLLCAIDIFSKFARVIELKDREVLQLLMLFKKS